MSSNEGMNLVEFFTIMKQDMLDFEEEWKKGAKENPEHWPKNLGEGDWYDQFLIYLSNRR